MLLLLSVALAGPTNEQALEGLASAGGWEDLGAVTTQGVGPISVQHKPMEGIDCLEASALTTHDPALLKEIILDIKGNLQWSSADLLASEILKEGGGRIDYLQVLNLPAPMTDRIWGLRGEVTESPELWSFNWRAIDLSAEYPEPYKAQVDEHGELVIIPINVGGWSLIPAEGGTIARFRACNDVGGRVPRWAGEKVARKMLPNNLVDLFTEADKRAASR